MGPAGRVPHRHEQAHESVPSASLVRLEPEPLLGEGAQGMGRVVGHDLAVRVGRLPRSRVHRFLYVRRSYTEHHLAKAPLATGGGGPHAFLSFDVAVTHRTEMHLMRRDFIKLFNAKHSDLDPPLRSSDALAVRLLPFGGLRTFQPDWTDFIERRDRRIQPGYLTPEELQHLEKKGIRFGASDASVGFQHVMDTRTPSAPDPSDLLGLPSLIGQSISGTFVWPEERVVFPKRPLKQVTLEPDEDDEQWWVRAIGVRRLRDF
ncbi:hypothetical protein MVLG_04734 [Microbotryum lychnidis-dioicae p1A1 Lamole]|uniref:Uncharacterized protein n=2 Tax=Microbotryum lychnidis-dioicae (strain p1A1 Lamole / MvSl-1064) TaxID=683840 RepID=U5HC45_USTV1|nr:hypothetical protein MVLG_04734 [Microbotryum lychnidis-dioicae p1A1 Lamole]|eukprot:KDE04874.1 hypothetical protein MVLG_04734 [Microbotryum lychnidis-dioicae p1A1 Lamole]